MKIRQVGVSDGAVSSDKIADNAVTEPKIATDAVRADEIQAGAVGPSEIADAAVVGGTGGDVADDTLTAADIAANAVGASELATNAVDADAIAAGALTAADAAADLATQAELDAHDADTTAVHGITDTAKLLQVAGDYAAWGAAAFATTRQPHATRPTLVIAIVEIRVNDTDRGEVELKVGTASPPTTVVASTLLYANNDAVGANADYQVQVPLMAIVPAGYNYRLDTTAHLNTPTFTLDGVMELTL